MRHSWKKRLTKILMTICLMSIHHTSIPLSSLAKNDPYPVFTSIEPRTFLYRRERLLFCDSDWVGQMAEHVGISISPFVQIADRGRNNKGAYAELGDIMGNPTGRWNMIAMLLGQTPEGQALAPKLVTAREAIFPTVPLTTPIDCHPYVEDPNFNFGFFTAPAKYRKAGVRFDMIANIFCDPCNNFGLEIQTGVADICQTVSGIIDLTCLTQHGCPFLGNLTEAEFTSLQQTVINTLMKQIDCIAKEIGLDICSFHEVSIEEVRFNLFWRHAYPMNFEKSPESRWHRFLLIPYVELSGSISPGRELDQRKRFGLPFGNNRHPSVGATAALDFNFVDTIEVGGQIGYTHFFKRDYQNFFFPNNQNQSGIFPFSTNVTIQPGHNWHFGLKLASYHFLEHLSFWFEYIQLDHGPDHFSFCEPDPAFVKECFEENTAFKVKIANVGFNYDLTPNIGLGFFWQAPLNQKNAYRSTTVMFTFYATF